MAGIRLEVPSFEKHETEMERIGKLVDYLVQQRQELEHMLGHLNAENLNRVGLTLPILGGDGVSELGNLGAVAGGVGLMSGPHGLRVTASGIEITGDGGKTWSALNGGTEA